MWCNFTFVRVKLTNFKNDYEPDKFKKLDPRRAELAGKNIVTFFRNFDICISV